MWAIAGLGVRCIIGTTFGDIFFANCAQNGVLVVMLESDEVAELQKLTADGSPVSVDLPSQTIEAENRQRWSFSILPAAKQSLLQGLDDVELAVAEDPTITAWQEQDRVRRPWVWAAPTSVPGT